MTLASVILNLKKFKTFGKISRLGTFKRVIKKSLEKLSPELYLHNLELKKYFQSNNTRYKLYFTIRKSFKTKL